MIVAKGNLNGNVVDKQNLKGKINTSIEYIRIYPEIQAKTVTPTKQIQTVLPDENVYALSQVTVNPIPNNYIEPQGQKEITENGTYDVTNYASANVNVPTPTPNLQSKSLTITENGTQTVSADNGYDGLDEVEITTNITSSGGKNIQNNSGIYAITGSSYHSTGLKLTVNKSGSYTVKWFAYKPGTGTNHGTGLYINGTLYGNKNETWGASIIKEGNPATYSFFQTTMLNNVSLSENDIIEIYAKSPNSSNPTYIMDLIIEEE